MSTQLPTVSTPPPIDAVPLRHPGRWLAAGLLVLGAGLLGYGAATNPAYGWPVYRRYLFDERIAAAAWTTVQLTVLAMVLAVGLGVALAIMRGSPNPVLRVLSWLYLWVFRGTPVYVQLIFWGLLPTLYGALRLGVPFGPTVAEIDLTDLSAAFVLAIVGLGLNEAAYLAEIIRAGIGSVPDGQVEAATALGMTRAQVLRRTVLPQAMRVIIPPTGNEVISMLKTTSLVTAVPYSLELYGRSRDIAGVIFEPIPLLLVAATWYLAITSVLMIGQHYLEGHVSRGMGRTAGLRRRPHR
ncbi:amino acid ABC transporter permease [Mycolicibacillus parakoreensis]|uniref:Amino acid ABC transporter permease n=1 Tax=Mycolicibacillus parakoreensis TaxID=1069221 RepID=A0ABY3U328_9MYCO|nr:amino acid ABC transporter permease [Mycolicibacillus parakoreensis]ULN54353.1 amino acid ABC transporter permease [Mycolicibacillus parakoreensis]